MVGHAVASVPGSFTQDQLLGGVVGIVLALLAVVLIYFGLRTLRHAFSILTNEPIDIADVDGAEGVVELQGSVEVLEEPMAAKYSDEPAVAYSYKRQERRERRTDDGETEVDWETVDQGERAIPFQVADETGTVAVDPAGAGISLNDARVERGATRDTKQIEGRLGPGDSTSTGRRSRAPAPTARTYQSVMATRIRRSRSRIRRPSPPDCDTPSGAPDTRSSAPSSRGA